MLPDLVAAYGPTVALLVRCTPYAKFTREQPVATQWDDTWPRLQLIVDVTLDVSFLSPGL